MSDIKVSTVIPLYNKGPYIKRAIDSVLNQELQPDEIIVVNDGSTDNGPDIVESIEHSKIKLINQKNKGVSAARNRGIKEANGDLIALLDADDEWLSNHLIDKVKLFNKYPEAGAIGSPYIVKDYKNKFIPDFKYVPKTEGLIDNYFKAILYKNPTCASVIVIKSSVFDNVGYFPIDIQRGEDNFMWSKIALEYPIGFVNKPSAIRYKDLEGRLSTQLSHIDDFPLLEYVKDNNIKLTKQEYFYLKEFVFRKYMTRAHQAILSNNIDLAKSFLNKSNNTKLFKKRLYKNYIKLYMPNKLYFILKKFKSKIKGLIL